MRIKTKTDLFKIQGVPRLIADVDFEFSSKWPPKRSLTLWDNQWPEIIDFGLKQNPKYATSVYTKKRIIFNRLSLI